MGILRRSAEVSSFCFFVGVFLFSLFIFVFSVWGTCSVLFGGSITSNTKRNPKKKSEIREEEKERKRKKREREREREVQVEVSGLTRSATGFFFGFFYGNFRCTVVGGCCRTLSSIFLTSSHILDLSSDSESSVSFRSTVEGFLTESYWLLPSFWGDFYRFALVLLGFVKFNYISTQVLPSFGRFYLVLLGFIQFFGGFYLVFLDFAP